MQLGHLLAWIANEPWAIEPAKAQEILAYLQARAVGGQSTHAQISLTGDTFDRSQVISLIEGINEAMAVDVDEHAEKIHPSKERSIKNRDGSIAVVALHGVMAQRRLPGASTGGGASTEAVGLQIDKAAADTAIKAIVLHIDSPGGAVAGTRELAAKVRAARDVKPVIAQVDSMAASAAYWVAAQATEIVSTPGGIVGSIGVIAVHEDISAALELQGIKPTIISAGKHKAEGNPFGPLDDEARAHFQDRVDESYADFVGGVALGREVSAKTVEAQYGQGRVLSASKAIAAGMIDRIATFDITLARFTTASQPSTQQRRARAAMAQARTS